MRDTGFVGAIRRLFRFLDERWRDGRVSRVALGKYIILFAALLNIGWAVILISDPLAAMATPVAFLTEVCGGPYRTAFTMVVFAVGAMSYIFIRIRISSGVMALLLTPLQFLLLVAAGAGIYAATVGHYADGVQRPSGFILVDQLPIILSALLYTVAVIEAAAEPPASVLNHGEAVSGA